MAALPPIASAYLDALTGRLRAAFDVNAEALVRAAGIVEAAARDDHLVYVFGTGHSHMLAEEIHYRAGGLAHIVPVLASPLMLHEGSLNSSAYERMPGVAATVLSRYPIGPGDVLIVISNSGVNAAPVEAIRIGKERGATTIALTSDEYSKMAAKGRPRIADLADIVLDNGAPSGDAVLEIPGKDLRVGPVTTSIGAALLHAVMAQAAAQLAASGAPVPAYVSANMPGAAEQNAGLIERYRKRNPHL